MKNIIKSLRKEKNLTQSELAERLDLDQTTVSKWELGKAIPDTQTLIKLSVFFDVSIDYIVGKSSFYYPDRINIESIELADDERKLLETFRKLTLKNKMHVSAYATVRLEEQDRGTRPNIG